MIIVPDHLVFVHVPKTAGTTISEFIRHRFAESVIDVAKQYKDDRVYGGHLPREQMNADFSKYMSSLPIFSVCRHPYDRLVSGFLHWIRDRGYGEGDYPQGFNFESWLKGKNHVMKLPLSTWIRESDIILRYENLSNDIIKMEEVLGFEIKLLKKNVGIRELFGHEYPKGNDIIRPDIKEYIQETYKEDFERFGYES